MICKMSCFKNEQPPLNKGATMNTSYISLGSNIEDRKLNISKALEEIKKLNDIDISDTSFTYETDPLPTTSGQSKFLNCMIKINTTLDAHDLMRKLQKIETDLGRPEDHDKWSSRTIDLDIIFYNNDIIDDPDLKIPHPEASKRVFVLKPLCDIASDMVHPVDNKTVRELLEDVLMNKKNLNITRKDD